MPCRTISAGIQPDTLCQLSYCQLSYCQLRTTAIFQRLRFPLRLLLWSSPLLSAAALLLPIRALNEHAALSRAGSLLVDGDAVGARELLNELRHSPRTGQRARAGLDLVDALDGRRSPLPDPSGVDAELPAPASAGLGTFLQMLAVETSRKGAVETFPTGLIARTAFERGEFDAALRVTELAESAGAPTVRLLTTAAWIEAGGIEEARHLAAGAPTLSGASLGTLAPGTLAPGTLAPGTLAPGTLARPALARQVAHHLETPEEQRGVLLRDRTGRPIGTTAGDVLALGAAVRPELVPRAVTAAVAGHRPSGSLRLTLDLELSEAAFSAFGRFRGSIVIVDPHTGEILAAVSDRRTWRRGGTPAFEQLREPASIAKLITTTAAMRAGYEPDAQMRRMRCRGHERYAGELLYCPAIVGPLRNLRRALAVSCNVAFASLGVRVGREAMLEEFRRYGFDSPWGLFASGRIVQADGDDRQLADLSIGLEASEITPLHAALLAAVMANDGVMPEPTLLAAEDGRLGLHPRPLAMAEGRRVIDRRWVPEVVAAMEAVVRRGTAQRVWPPSAFPVAMKTGTASDPRYGFHVNYIGIGPMPDARLAFCVRITDRPTSAKVRYAAQRVTHRLLRNLGRIAERRGWSPGKAPERHRTRLAEARSAPGARRGSASASRPVAGVSDSERCLTGTDTSCSILKRRIERVHISTEEIRYETAGVCSIRG